MEVIMYTKTPCGACDTVEMLLKQRNVEVIKKDILADEQAFQEVIALGFSGVPVVVTSDQSVPPFLGVDVRAIEQVAKSYHS